MNQNVLAEKLYTMYRQTKGGVENGHSMLTWHEIAQPSSTQEKEFKAWLNVAVTAKKLLGVSDPGDGIAT